MTWRGVFIALAILGAVVAFARCDRTARAGDVTAQPSILMVVGGAPWCHVTPAPGGYYGAKHCHRSGHAMSADGYGVLPYSLDPTRDLMHLAVPGMTAPLAVAAWGDVLAWRSERGAGRYVAGGPSWLIGSFVPYLSACPLDGGELGAGDSGTGLWSADGLVGIFTNFEEWPSGACDHGRMVWLVTVP